MATLVTLAGRVAAWLVVPLALLQGAILLARRVLGIAAPAAGEMVLTLAVPLVLLTIPLALLAGRHVAVEVVSERLRPAARRLVLRTGALAALAAALVLLWLAVPYAHVSWLAGETSPDPQGLGARWAVKAILPLFAALLTLAALIVLVRGRHAGRRTDR